MENNLRNSLPTLDDGGVNDETMASPALGFGMPRQDLMPPDLADPDKTGAGQSLPYGHEGEDSHPTQGSPYGGAASGYADADDAYDDEYGEYDDDDYYEDEREVLGRNEVAAVSGARSYYVRDEPSPYLSMRQAHENIEDTRHRQGVIRGIMASLLVLALLAGVGAFIYNYWPTHEVFEAPQYQTVNIEHGEFLDTVDATVLVEPIDTRAVSARASGNVQQVVVEVGSKVNEGDALFVLENSTITDSFNRSQVLYDDAVRRQAEKRTKLDEANTALATAQATVDSAKTDAERTVAETALATAKGLAAGAQAEFDAADATLQTVTETFTHAQEQLSALTVRSPIGGTVTDIPIDIAIGAAVSSATQLCTVSDLTTFALHIQVPTERRAMTTEGQEVRVTFPDIEGLSVTATVTNIEDVDGASIAQATIYGPDERIQAGMQAQASLILQDIPNSYIVPLDAISYAEDGTAHLTVLLDPARGISTDIPITIRTTSPTHAAVEADNIQGGNAVILPGQDIQDVQ